MPTIPDSIIEDVRQRTDIAEIIGRSISLKRQSGGWVGLCPFHHEKTPSFHVNEARQRFHCFGCGQDGDVFKFLMLNDGMTFLDAVRFLAEKAGIVIREEEDDGSRARLKRLYHIHAEAAAFFRRCLLQTKEAETARAYLERRRLTGEIAERFQLGYVPMTRGVLNQFAQRNRFTIAEMVEAGLGTLPDRPTAESILHNRFRGRLMFPICDHTGRVIAFSGRILDSAASPAKYVNSPETPIFKKARVLYALDKAQRAIANSQHREAILCEGQIDVIRCHACGFPRAVASEGTAFTAEHAQLLHRYADSAIELFDSDKAGRKAAIRTAAILLAEGIPVRIASLPEGEDPDSFLLKHPPEAFQKILDDARDVVAFQVEYLRAQEQDPDSPGAAGRIVRETLQTIAACSNPVHRERMLQDLSRILQLSMETIRDEMTGVVETLRRREQSAERRAAARADATPLPPPSPAAPPPGTPGMAAAPAAAPSAASAPGTPAAAREPPPSPLDSAVCEFLLNHCLLEPGTLNALARYLPVSIFPNAMIRRILEAFYASIGASTDPVLDLQEADPQVAAFLGAVATQRDRVGIHEHYQPKDVARNLICKAWSRHLQQCVDESAQSGDMSPEAVRKRAEYTRTIRQLRTWATGEAKIRELCGVSAEEAEALRATPPPVHPTPAPEELADLAPVSAAPAEPSFLRASDEDVAAPAQAPVSATWQPGFSVHPDEGITDNPDEPDDDLPDNL